jgi:hypothetical protein
VIFTLDVYSLVDSPPPSDSPTSGTAELTTLEESISFPEDSPARTSATPELEPESRESDLASGANLSGSFAFWDRATSSWRTYQLCLTGELDRFSGIFPRAGTMRSGTVYQHPPSAPLTEETESSSWPTPQARDWKNGTNLKNPSNCRPLNEAVWRTPQARDGNGRGASSVEARQEQGHSISMHDQIGGQLSPMWVSALMGFPPDWTEI